MGLLASTCLFLAFSWPTGVICADPIGPSVRVSPIPGVQNEPDVAALGDRAIAVWYRNPAGYNVGWGFSLDGGSTWVDGGVLPDNASTAFPTGHPTVCVDNAGHFFAAAVFGTDNGWGVGVWRGSFQGPSFTWGPAIYATPLKAPSGLEPVDAPFISCDPARGYLYVTYTHTRYVTVGGNYVEYFPYFVRSLDGGQTWSAPQTLGSAYCNGVRSAVGPDGELYVVWEDYSSGQMLGRKSTDFGAGFGPGLVLATIRDNQRAEPPGWLAPQVRYNPAYYPQLDNPPPNFPSIAVDRTTGPYRGRVYVTWTEYAVGTVGPGSGVVSDQEPNDFFANATPVAIGQDVVHYIPNYHYYPPNCGWFSFVGTEGTTLWMSGEITYVYPTPSIPLSWRLFIYCGDDTTRLVQQTEVDARPEWEGPLPPLILTFPRTGRYWFNAGCGSAWDISVTYHLRAYTPAAGQAARDHRDVLLVTSSDRGATWSPQVRVNDAPPRYDECFPAVAVDDLGQVHVAWYDRRDAGACGVEVETYWAVSRDGGASFYPSRRLSARPSTWNCAGAGPNLGDHLAVRAAGNRVQVLWTQVGCPDTVDIYGVTIAGDDPTGIAVAEFSAEDLGSAVRVRWRVGDGRGITGFRVERAVGSSAGFAALATDPLPLDGRSEYVAKDETVEPGERYRYRLAVEYADGSTRYIGPVEIALGALPAKLSWTRAAPSPFHDGIELSLAVPHAGEALVEVYSLAGQRVATLLRGAVSPGPLLLGWDGRDRAGRPSPPGIYLLRAQLAKEVATQRIVQLQ